MKSGNKMDTTSDLCPFCSSSKKGNECEHKIRMEKRKIDDITYSIMSMSTPTEDIPSEGTENKCQPPTSYYTLPTNNILLQWKHTFLFFSLFEFKLKNVSCRSSTYLVTGTK